MSLSQPITAEQPATTLPVYHDHCAECCGPVTYKTRFEVVRDTLAWDLFMALPDWLAFSRFGFAIAPYAGGHAYTCTCPSKVFR